MPSPESSTQRIVVTPTTSAIKTIEVGSNHIIVNPAAGPQVSVVNAGPQGPYGNGLYVPDHPWMDSVDDALEAIAGATTQVYSSRKTDGDTDIGATTAGSPTRVTGVYIQINSASYDRVVKLTGTVMAAFTSGGNVTGRAVLFFPAIRVNSSGNYVNDLYPMAGVYSTGANDYVPNTITFFDRVYVLPAGQSWEIQMYGYRAAATEHVAVARNSHTSLTALVMPVNPVVL